MLYGKVYESIKQPIECIVFLLSYVKATLRLGLEVLQFHYSLTYNVVKYEVTMSDSESD